LPCFLKTAAKVGDKDGAELLDEAEVNGKLGDDEKVESTLRHEVHVSD
jgi:hypothetical protein